jgi:hypothetical protein
VLPKRAGAKKAYEKEMARKAAKAATKASDERQANPTPTPTLTPTPSPTPNPNPNPNKTLTLTLTLTLTTG